jgi:dephospho-CoA kinase
VLRVGITGGIGSGKTTVCKIFEELGIPVYYADYWAKWLTTHDEAVRSAIIALLGSSAYDEQGQYNRAWVAQQVFADKAKLAGLNAILHPAVEHHSRRWHEALPEELPYSLKEAALMVESGSHVHLDQLIVVTAPEALRVARVVARDGVSEAQVLARMAHQLPEADKVALADEVIVNDGQRSLVKQVWDIHQRLQIKRLL